MARPTALLIAGGAPYHNTSEHYELLAGLLQNVDRHLVAGL